MSRYNHFSKISLLASLIGFCPVQGALDPLDGDVFHDEEEVAYLWESPYPASSTLRDKIIQKQQAESLNDNNEAVSYFQDWYEELDQAAPFPSKPKNKTTPFHDDRDFLPIDSGRSSTPNLSIEDMLAPEELSRDITDEEIEKQHWRVEPEHSFPLYKPGHLSDHLFDEEETAEAEIPAVQSFAPIRTPEEAETPAPAEEPPAPVAPEPVPEPPAPPVEPPAIEDAAPVEEEPNDAILPEAPIESPIFVPPGKDSVILKPAPVFPSDLNQDKLIRVNFPNISISEFIRYISRQSNKNFIFNEDELQFNVTIVSEEDTTIENLMTALLQELRINGFRMMEQGNNVIIYKNETTNAISKVIDADENSEDSDRSEVVTRVFRLNTLEGTQAAAILTPLTSDKAIITVVPGTNNLVVTDLSANVQKMAQLLKSLDSPVNGVVIGQYAVQSNFIDVLVENAQRIMEPIAGEQTFTLVAHYSSKSIFVVSTPYLVQKAIQVLRYLDQSQAATSIQGAKKGWELDDQGNWIFNPQSQQELPTGEWYLDKDGNWIFRAPGEDVEGLTKPSGGQSPGGSWIKDENGNWVYKLKPGQSISTTKVDRTKTDETEGLPLGHIEKTRFSIIKLKYRKGDQVSDALRNIGATLSESDTSNKELLDSINSVQWIESSNSLIFTGTPIALRKVNEFIDEIDVPLRQVFIEVLVMEMTLNDSLQYGVNWGTQMGGGNTALSETFSTTDSQLRNIMASGDLSAGGGTPAVSGLAASQGYRLGVMGQKLTRCGIQFDNIAALVKAVHHDEDTRIVMNPKIFTEDNNPAELFVGLEVQYPTQSISNGDINNTITQNYETKEVGTKLTVTPQIGNNDVITLDIIQEISNIANAATQQQTQSLSTAGKTTTKSSTKTRVHVPNNFFVVLSGQIQTEEDRTRDNVPCLGAAPFIGGAFAEKRVAETKRNLMIFIRPSIIDTDEQLDNLTEHHQNQYRNKSYSNRTWEYEVDEALDLLNLKDTSANGKVFEGCYSD